MPTEHPPTPGKNIAETLRETIEGNADFSFVTSPGLMDGGAQFAPGMLALISLPEKRRVEDLTGKYAAAAQLLKPWRRKGTARLMTLLSFTDWANRNKGETSVIFANPDTSAPSLTCITNYHGAGPAALDGTTPDATAQHGDHRGLYAFPLSKEWQRWMAISGKALEKDQMAQFIEDNAKDFIDPTPPLLADGKMPPDHAWEEKLIEQARKIDGRFGHHLKLIEMSRAFQVHESSNLTVTANRDTGESTISFVNQHSDDQGRPLSIPNLFLIAISVFESGVMYRLPVRFQYRKSGSAVKFILTVYDPSRAFDDAFEEAIDIATKATELPVFIGLPEA